MAQVQQPGSLAAVISLPSAPSQAAPGTRWDRGDAGSWNAALMAGSHQTTIGGVGGGEGDEFGVNIL